MTSSPATSEKPLAVTPADEADIAAVTTLWERCGLTQPWNDPRADFTLARGKPNSDVLVGRDGTAIVASALVGHDGHRGWVWYVSVDPDRQGVGYGRAIMAAAEDWLRERGIEKLHLLVRAGNSQVRGFYENLEFTAIERIVYAKWLDGRPMTP